MLVDGRGIPIGLAVSGANRHDMKLAKPTLKSLPVERPEPTPEKPQNMCLDKGYDYPETDELIDEWGYTGHIARRGVDQSKRKRIPGYRARRWVVERTHSWLNRFRRLLIRWDAKKENYVAMIHFVRMDYVASGRTLRIAGTQHTCGIPDASNTFPEPRLCAYLYGCQLFRRRTTASCFIGQGIDALAMTAGDVGRLE